MTAVHAPLVVDVKWNSLDDGPGIRAVVFFKGCPLACAWCQNPEAIAPEPELVRAAERCLGCDACRAACPAGAARPAREAQAAACRLAGACVAACPAGARRVAGTRYGVDELADLLLRDEPFYRRSGGGVTFSGGEPTMAPAFAGRLAARLRARGVHVLVETAGHFGWEPVARELLPHVSAVYFDLKLADDAAHRRHTGQSNALILENLGRLAAAGAPPLLPRVPLVPGITDTDENLGAIAELLRGFGLERVALLPYNPLYLPKRRALGLAVTYDRETWMSRADIARCEEVFRRAGVAVV